MKNNWYKFWEARAGIPVYYRPFHNNYRYYMVPKIVEKFGQNYKGLKSLEIGSGRGIMSDYLHGSGWDTYCVDKYYVPPDNGQNHKFFQADAFDLPFPDEYFDLVFSYGLLEHFSWSEQEKIYHHAHTKTKTDGLCLHYIVPKKITNMFEDKNVYRDRCELMRMKNSVTWVYPLMHICRFSFIPLLPAKCKWETNKFLGKGFWV